MTWIGNYRRNLITFKENFFYLLTWWFCSAYIAILTLICVRFNVSPTTVFWLYNSVHLVFIDIFHGLVIPWRMEIPWRTPQEQQERPATEFYVLKPPELRVGRFDKMATQRPAPTPPPPSLCSSLSLPSPSLSFARSEFSSFLPSIDSLQLCHPHCPDSPERGKTTKLEPNFRKLSLVSSSVSLPIIPIIDAQSSPQLKSPCSLTSSPNLPLTASPFPHPHCTQASRRIIQKQPRHLVFSPVSINSLSLPPSLNSVVGQGCSLPCLSDLISSLPSSSLTPIPLMTFDTPPPVRNEIHCPFLNPFSVPIFRPHSLWQKHPSQWCNICLPFSSLTSFFHPDTPSILSPASPSPMSLQQSRSQSMASLLSHRSSLFSSQNSFLISLPSNPSIFLPSPSSTDLPKMEDNQYSRRFIYLPRSKNFIPNVDSQISKKIYIVC